MRYRAFVLCLLVVTLFSAGCADTMSQSGLTPQGKSTPTPAGYGSIMISSDPWGAEVYLDGESKGTAPLTLTNVPAGKYNLLVTMLGYKESNTTITVTADKSLTVKKSLQKGKPDIYVGIESTKMLQQDTLIEVVGAVENRGEEAAYEFKLIIEMTPKDSKQKDLKATKTIVIGTLNPKDQKHYVGHMQLKRGVDYKGTIKCEYTYEGKTVKGSTKSL